ncbi:GGDEF domain-containing response regulator [Okeanomitos corallinicola TIOX110]|uniref:GGDEF domain-containing response regulator n=1 Tax=Okeanomitos corallinicola TIOX110 TaxID=3133117 RepID=A0ABZ2UVL9_9CYAN
MNYQLKILIVEDNPDDAELIVLELEQANYQVFYQQVDTGEAMANAMESQAWDVIISDYSMPSFSAFAALDLFKQLNLDIPFIVVSGSIGEETAAQLMRNGAHDYLLKHNLTRLAPAIDRELREAKIRCERKQALEKVEFLAFYDELTKLPNRHAFLETLQQYVDHGDNFAVVFIEIDQYRQIKYGFGHIKSEQLIINIATRLKDNLQPGDFLARIGKDEFALIFTNCDAVNNVEKIATELHCLIDPPFDLQGFIIYASITIGIVDSSIGFRESAEFLRAAEIANHNAKKQGLQNIGVLYNQQMQTQALKRLQTESELRQAISNHEVKLFYQPIVELSNFKLAGFEALIRWQHPQKGWISPDEFIPLAEETGLIIPLGEFILETAYNQIKIWQDQLSDYLPLSLSVNMSCVQLEEIAIVPQIINKYQSLGLDGVTLKLEITESSLMNNTPKIIQCLQQFRVAGIQISIDDFGTGYSSLSYLKNLPIDVLKIDRAFVSRIEERKDFGIMQAIIALAQTLDLDVVSEGIETTAQMELLRSLGCKYGQGYLFSPAIPADKIQNWLKKINRENIDYKSLVANSLGAKHFT